ncbi:MAG: hypothetical protein H0W64_11305 [Gammaproteobacteria bacterium]|nr:hypothetical protein [Gammaproteobacteria bacterium]
MFKNILLNTNATQCVEGIEKNQKRLSDTKTVINHKDQSRLLPNSQAYNPTLSFFPPLLESSESFNNSEGFTPDKNTEDYTQHLMTKYGQQSCI